MALRNEDDLVCEALASGRVGHADSADFTQAAYFENLGIRQGLSRCADLYVLLDRHFDIEGKPEEDEGQLNDD